MRKKFMQIVAFMLTLSLSVPVGSAATLNAEGEVMIRVGLASSSKHSSTKELSAAHLQSNTGFGSGYRFGYYDANLNFVELACTTEDVTDIAMLKTQNQYYGYVSSLGKNTYSDTITSDIGVGCYHIRIGDVYDSYQAALEAANALGGFVAWIDGQYQVRVGAYMDRASAEAAAAQLGQGEIVGTSAYGVSVVKTGTNEILFQYDMGEGSALAVMPDVTGAEDVRTWCLGYKYRGGFTFRRVSGGNLTVVNVLSIEDYVKGVACYEMGRLWPLEALKTQVVCARTYATKHMGNHSSLGFDVCNTDNCQVYRGVGTNSSTYGPSDISDQAAEETAGQVIWYQDSLASTFYSSSHGGASEEIANVWTSNDVGDYPYLCGVIDPYEETVSSINARSSWKVTYSKAALTKQLQSKGFGTKTSVDHLVLHYSAMGNVIKLEVHWTNGQKNTFKPSDGASSIRSAFGLHSIRFTVNGETVTKETGGDSQYTINKTQTVTGLKDLYVLTGSGTVSQIQGTACIISGAGEISAVEEQTAVPGTNEGGGTVTISADEFVFEGGGWGHQIGMSQYGAYAMAQLGFAYDEICEFYFPGTEVRPYLDQQSQGTGGADVDSGQSGSQDVSNISQDLLDGVEDYSSASQDIPNAEAAG